ncbi:MAG: zinc-dependent alcohol dehydrogenase [Actinomycetota bacterium]
MLTTAVQFSAPRAVELIDIELPTPVEGQALVSSLYSGISSGTEMLAYRGEIDPDLPLDESIGALSGTFSWPFQYGYSVVGKIEESRCSLQPGATVFCFHQHQAHLLAEQDEMTEISGIDARVATLLPLVETALQISLDAGPVANQHVLVMGLGAVGILTGALLHRAGATVLAADPLPWRRTVADSFSLTSVDPTELKTRVADVTGGLGISLVVEASGKPEVLSGVLELMAHEGTVLVASWFGTKPVALPLGGAFHRRRLTIRSSQVSTIPERLAVEWTKERRLERTLHLMKELPLARLTTHEFPLSQVSDAFRAVDSPPDGLIHAAINYQEV